MTFGQSQSNFLINSAEAVGQLVVTGLKLFQGEFFLNTTAGMPWDIQVIGFNTQALYDNAIKAQIIGTQGVTGITSYSSSLNKLTRLLTVTVGLATQFGPTTISTAVPTLGGWGVGGYSQNPYGE